jgi:hypothetical protein
MSQNKDSTINLADLEGGSSLTIGRVVVKDQKERKAICFLSVRLVNGRIKYILTVKKGKDGKKETIKEATADWVV